MALAPQWLAKYASSDAVERHETLTPAAPMRAAPACTSRNSGRLRIIRMTLVLRANPRRWRAAAARFIRESISAHVRLRSRHRTATLSGEFAA